MALCTSSQHKEILALYLFVWLFNYSSSQMKGNATFDNSGVAYIRPVLPFKALRSSRQQQQKSKGTCDWESPGNLTLKVSGIWLPNFHRTGETETLGGHKQNLVCIGPRGKEQWPHRRLSQTYLWVSEGLLQRCVLAGACWGDGGTDSNSPRSCVMT